MQNIFWQCSKKLYIYTNTILTFIFPKNSAFFYLLNSQKEILTFLLFQISRQNLIEDKCEVTIENDKSSNEISEYDQDQGIIKVRTRPNIPVNLKLRVFNGASEAAQQYIEIDETKKRKLGIILTSVMTMTNHSGFKVKTTKKTS